MFGSWFSADPLHMLCLFVLLSPLSWAGDKMDASQRKSDLLDKKIRLFCKRLASSDLPGAVAEIVVLEKQASFAESITQIMVAARRDMEREYGRFTGKVELVSEDILGTVIEGIPSRRSTNSRCSLTD